MKQVFNYSAVINGRKEVMKVTARDSDEYMLRALTKIWKRTMNIKEPIKWGEVVTDPVGLFCLGRRS